MYKKPDSYAFGQQNQKNATSADNQFIYERKVPVDYETTAQGVGIAKTDSPASHS